ncbi:ankyrin repeat-containing domain protein [Zopfochytrium polystomum]|nr:ankyrin repeat-containing domain protein [Zopfochytrium polystomum]
MSSSREPPSDCQRPDAPKRRRLSLSHDDDGHRSAKPSTSAQPSRAPGLCAALHAQGVSEPLHSLKFYLAEAGRPEGDWNKNGCSTHHSCVARWLVRHDCADFDAVKATIRDRRSQGFGFDLLAATEGLLHAIDGDRLDLVDFFLECGASTEGIDAGVDHPLADSVPLRRAFKKGAFPIVRLLIMRGADVNRRIVRESWSGDVIEDFEEWYWYPFLAACSSGRADIARELLQHGAKIFSADFEDLFSAAVKSASLETVQLLLEHCMMVGGNTSCHTLDSALETALLAAAKSGNADITCWLYNYVTVNESGSLFDEDDQSLLQVACEGGNLRIVEFLLSQGWKRRESDVLLEAAAVSGSTAIAEMLLSRETLRCMCDGSDEISAFDGGNNAVGCTALLLAAQNDQIELMHVLLDYGASVDSKDHAGKTALHYACEWGLIDIVRLLLEAGANRDARCANELTPMDYAKRGEEDDIVQLLKSWQTGASAKK